jgi:hypothetical protein
MIKGRIFSVKKIPLFAPPERASGREQILFVHRIYTDDALPAGDLGTKMKTVAHQKGRRDFC